MNRFRRLRYLIRWVLHGPSEINRRVGVEAKLLQAYSTGKGLTPEQCRKLALQLGTPKEHWPEYLKEV